MSARSASSSERPSSSSLLRIEFATISSTVSFGADDFDEPDDDAAAFCAAAARGRGARARTAVKGGLRRENGEGVKPRRRV